MSNISNTYSNVGASYEASYQKSTNASDKVNETNEAKSSSKIPGKTVGTPKLSEKALDYYEELRKKYHNLEFVLVSRDQKENAKNQATSYAQKNKMVVLIDEDKIERMATDSAYRAQYEGIIEKASVGLTQFSASVAKTGANVKGYGVQANDDGTLSYFAVLEKSSEAQAKRIEEKRAAKAQQRKADAKKAQKKQNEERLEKAREARKTGKIDKNESEDEVVLTAGSFEELARKIEDYVQTQKTDSVVTEAEKKLGKNIDFSL